MLIDLAEVDPMVWIELALFKIILVGALALFNVRFQFCFTIE